MNDDLLDKLKQRLAELDVPQAVNQELEGIAEAGYEAVRVYGSQRADLRRLILAAESSLAELRAKDKRLEEATAAACTLIDTAVGRSAECPDCYAQRGRACLWRRTPGLTPARKGAQELPDHIHRYHRAGLL